MPGFPAGTEVTPEGYLYTGSAEYVFQFGPRYRAWNVPVRTLTGGRYPIVNSSAREGAITYSLSAFAAQVGGQPVNFVRVRMTNRGGRTATAGWAIGTRYTGGEPKGNGRRFRFARPATPWRPGLYYQPGYAFNPHSTLAFAGHAFLRDGRALYVSHATPRGVSSRRIRGPRRPSVTSLVGVTRYRVRIRPGRTVTLDFTAPTVPVDRTTSAYGAIGSTTYDSARRRMLSSWRRMLGRATQIQVPERKVVDTYYTSIMNLLLSRYQQDGHWIQTVNDLQYHAFWLRDSAAITSAFDRVGLHEVAAQDLNFVQTWQGPDGLFMSRPGQYDGWGQALWAYGDHFRHTGDVAFAKTVLPAVVRAMSWLEKARAADPLGLLPASDPHDNELVAGHLTGDNFWGVAGAQAAATLARAAGDDQSAERWSADAAAYRATLDARLRQAVKRTEGWIPPALDANGGQDWGNLWPFYPTGIYHATDPMVEQTMRLARSKFAEGIATYLGRDLHHYLGFRVFETDLAAGRQSRAVAGLYSELAHTTATNGGFETGVIVGGSRAVDDDMTPHGWFAAEYMTYLRNMLVREDPSGITLMSALSPAWVGHGRTVSVKGAATTFGRVSFTLRTTSKGARLSWRAEVPEGTRIVWPLPSFAKDSRGRHRIVLPARSGTLAVHWKLRQGHASFARAASALRAAYAKLGH